MTEKHYPYCGGSFDRIIFDKDGSVWVPETENAKLRELVSGMWRDGMCECDERGACATCEYGYLDRMRELGIEVDA